MKLTQLQKNCLNEWFNTALWCYNKALGYCKEKWKKCRKLPNRKELRNEFLGNSSVIEKKLEWTLRTPYDIRDDAMYSVLEAYYSNFEKRKINPNHRFKIKFKKKKKMKQGVIHIHQKAFINNKINPQIMKYSPLTNEELSELKFIKLEIKKCKDKSKKKILKDRKIQLEKKLMKKKDLIIKSSEPIPKNIGYDSKIIKTKNGRYYFTLLKPIEKLPDNQRLKKEDQIKCIGLDPGVRTFQTGFDTDGNYFEWAKGDYQKLYEQSRKWDILHSKWNQKTTKHRKRYRMKKLGNRILERIKNKVKDCHHKLSKYLCENYDVILLPRFETQNMVSKKNKKFRKINSKTARSMMTWNHYLFQQRLLSKSKRYSGCKVLIVSEEYTSKTCGAPDCGNIHWKLGSNEVFHCPRVGCEKIMDRDIQSGRNVILLFVTKYNPASKTGTGLDSSL